MHIDEIALDVAKGAHAMLLLDQAGWHTTGKLRWPKNITPILLPSRSPELNPVEQVWQYLRASFLSNRDFETYDDIIEAACDVWRHLIAVPQTITSIGSHDRANIGQTSGKLACPTFENPRPAPPVGKAFKDASAAACVSHR